MARSDDAAAAAAIERARLADIAAKKAAADAAKAAQDAEFERLRRDNANGGGA
jgi:hypothetical protein